MATEVIRIDDVDAAKGQRTLAEKTVVFSMQIVGEDGEEIEGTGQLKLDLSGENVKRFYEQMQPWIDAASPYKPERRARGEGAKTGPTKGMTPEDLEAFREWAEREDVPVERYERADGKPGAYKYIPAQIAKWRQATQQEEPKPEAAEPSKAKKS